MVRLIVALFVVKQWGVALFVVKQWLPSKADALELSAVLFSICLYFVRIFIYMSKACHNKP